jgi:hypothetical protein
MLSARVTRLGDFSPNGWSFMYSGQWFENYIISANFWANFTVIPVMYYFLQKMALATFWATFSQTHLVTLLSARH